MKLLNPFEKQQYRIAVSTLKMPNEIVGVMGGMNKKEAKAIRKKLEGKMLGKNPGIIKLKSTNWDNDIMDTKYKKKVRGL